jgi:hypothetical protein
MDGGGVDVAGHLDRVELDALVGSMEILVGDAEAAGCVDPVRREAA